MPPKMMAEQHRIARTRGKSDPIDAAAVARAALREPDLPVASHDETSRELKLLVDRREDLVTTRTATINRLLWRVHELDPAWAPPAKSLDLAKHQQALRARLNSVVEDGVVGLVAELAAAELAEIIELTDKINTLAKRIEKRTVQVAPTLLAMPGVGPLTAAKLVGEAAGVARFKSEAAFARHSGIAPIPVWSGNTAGRVRLTRSGNRAAQRGRASDRDHPDPPRRPRAGLLPQEEGRGHVQPRSTALPKTPPRPHRLQPPPHRPRRCQASSPSSRLK